MWTAEVFEQRKSVFRDVHRTDELQEDQQLVEDLLCDLLSLLLHLFVRFLFAFAAEQVDGVLLRQSIGELLQLHYWLDEVINFRVVHF